MHIENANSSGMADRLAIWAELDSGNLGVVETIVRLRYLTGEPQVEEFYRFVEWLQTDDLQLASIAARGLKSLLGRSDGVTLQMVFEAVDPDLIARVAHVLAMGDALLPDRVSRLLELSGGPGLLGGLSSCAALGRQAADCIPKVRGLLSGEEDQSLALACIALARMGDTSPATRARIRELLVERSDPGLRHMAALAYVETGPPCWSDLPILSRALSDAPQSLWAALELAMDDYGLPLDDLRRFE